MTHTTLASIDDKPKIGPKRHSSTPLGQWLPRARDVVNRWKRGVDFAVVMQAFEELGADGQRHGIPPKELLQELSHLMAIADFRGCRPAVPGLDPSSQSSVGLKTCADFARYYLIRGYQDSLR